MMNRIFGRSENIEELIGGLEARIDEQNRSLIVTGTAVVELEKVIENMRKYNEGMEIRMRKQSEEMVDSLRQEFEKGFDSAVQMIKAEVTSLGKLARPNEVVKAIDSKTKGERKKRQYRAVHTRLERMMAKYLVNDLPLHKEIVRYKHPELTPQGLKVYEAISDFLVRLAKVSGKTKEQFTNYGKYRKFFRVYQIEPYTKMQVRRPDGTGMHTLLAAIIVNGHVRQYLDYIQGMLEEEMAKVKKDA